MSSFGASIPPELFKNILGFVGDAGRLGYDRYYGYLTNKIDPVARREEMKQLSACASTCVYWAQLTRPCMFEFLVLRSAKDMSDLLFLLRAPQSPRIDPICDMLTWLYVAYTLGDYPWFHNLTRLFRKTPTEENLISERQIWVGLYITGPPKPKFVAAAARGSVLHPLFFSTPSVFPIWVSRQFFVKVTIENIHLPNPTILLNLLQDCLRLPCQQWRCSKLTWDLTRALPVTPSSMGLRYARPARYLEVQSISGCTDDSLVGSMMHSIPHHRLSQHQQVPYLTLQDTSRLFDLMQLTMRGWPALNIWSTSDPYNDRGNTAVELLPGVYINLNNIYTSPLSHADISNIIA